MRLNRRELGERLLLEPHNYIALDSPKITSKQEIAAQREKTPSIKETFNMFGRDVELDAVSQSLFRNYDFGIDPGNIGSESSARLIQELNPRNQFAIDFSIDNQFETVGDKAFTDKQRFKISREVNRRFNKMFEGMPEGSIVTNQPEGAAQGDFGRADLYMRNGFGPLQVDGTQYGIIKGGQVIPISPFRPDKNYAMHIAKRLEAGGDLERAAAIMSQMSGKPTNPELFASAATSLPSAPVRRMAGEAVSVDVSTTPMGALPPVEQVDPRTAALRQRAERLRAQRAAAEEARAARNRPVASTPEEIAEERRRLDEEFAAMRARAQQQVNASRMGLGS